MQNVSRQQVNVEGVWIEKSSKPGEIRNNESLCWPYLHTKPLLIRWNGQWLNIQNDRSASPPLSCAPLQWPSDLALIIKWPKVSPFDTAALPLTQRIHLSQINVGVSPPRSRTCWRSGHRKEMKWSVGDRWDLIAHRESLQSCRYDPSIAAPSAAPEQESLGSF